MMFGILIYKFVILINSRILNDLHILVEFLKPYEEYEFINYRETIEVDRAIAMILNKLTFRYSNRYIAINYCVEQSTNWK